MIAEISFEYGRKFSLAEQAELQKLADALLVATGKFEA
jgi:hypothetical protein